MTEVQGKTKYAAPKGASPDVAYYSPDQSRIPDFNFDQISGPDRGFRVQRIDAGELMGSSVFESALYTPSHIDTRVFQSLAQSMEVIEKKLHGGQYDAQAMPLIEAFLAELRKMAQIQVERNKINDQRICDLKEANIAAYRAVGEARERREEGIEKARMYRFGRMASEFDKRTARVQMADEHETEKEETAKKKKAVRLERREARQEAREARRRRRYERQMRREQARAEKEVKKWEKWLAKSESELAKVKSEKDVKQVESLSRQASAEAEIEIARVKAREAVVLGEHARLELERVRALASPMPETTFAGKDAMSEEPSAEVVMGSDGETLIEPVAEVDGEASTEVEPEVGVNASITEDEPGELVSDEKLSVREES